MTSPSQAALPVADEPQIAPAIGGATEYPAALPNGLVEGYRQFFEVVPAVTDQLKRHHYRVRHEVYCRELGYEPVCGDGLESDAYDRHSVHCLVRSAATHMFAGCARIVLADPASPDAPLPFEQTCGLALDRTIVDPATLDRSAIGEISRLAVIEQYRRRPGEHRGPIALEGNVGQGSRIRLPYLTLAIYLALLALARWKNVGTLFLLSEPALARSVSRLGVEVRQIGSPVDHRGVRVPSMLDVERIVARLPPPVRPLFDAIVAEVEQGVDAVC